MQPGWTAAVNSASTGKSSYLLTLPALAPLATWNLPGLQRLPLGHHPLALRHPAPVTAGLATLKGNTYRWPVITAGALLATIPTWCVRLLARYFIQGLTLARANNQSGMEYFELGVCYYPEQWPLIDGRRRQDDAGSRLSIVRIGEFAWTQMEPAEGVLLGVARPGG